MSESTKSSTVRVRISEMTVHVEDPGAPLDRITVRRSAGNSLDEKSLREAVETFAGAVAELERAFAIARITQGDCVEIHTGQCTTIRVNCPTITLGEPTIE